MLLISVFLTCLGEICHLKLLNYMILISVISTNSTITLTSTDDSQAISSPNYAGTYPDHLDITFVIYSPENTNVKFTFLDFSIDTDYSYDYMDCYYDQFIIYEGKYIM